MSQKIAPSTYTRENEMNENDKITKNDEDYAISNLHYHFSERKKIEREKYFLEMEKETQRRASDKLKYRVNESSFVCKH